MDATDPITYLDDSAAQALLAEHRFGRLVTRSGEHLEIFPLNYWSDGHRILFRTGAGTKLASTVISDSVLFEIDDVAEDEAWSVIARGTPRILETEAEIDAAMELDLTPRIPTLKPVLVEVAVGSISGRRFHFGDEPEAEPETIS